MAYTIDGDDVLLAILDGVEQRHGLWSADSSADAGEPHFSEPGDVSSSSESSSSDSEGSAARALAPQRKRRHARRKSRAARGAAPEIVDAAAEGGDGPALDVIESALQDGLHVSVTRARHGATPQFVVLWLEGDVLRWSEKRTAAASKRNRVSLGDVRAVTEGPAADELVLMGEGDAAIITVGASSASEAAALVSGLRLLSALAERR